MADNMTIKQIAELAGVDRTTVVRWIGRMDRALCTEIGAKCTEADKTKKPARFTLDETLEIIRAGGRSTLADLLAQNAGAGTVLEAPAVLDVGEIIKSTIQELMPSMTVMMVAAIKQIQAPAASIPRQARLPLPAESPDGEYYTIKGYGNRRGLRVTKSVAISLGRDASRLSRLKNIEIRKIKDLEWGQVNAYHVSILQDIFTI